MEGLIVLAVIWFVVTQLTKATKKAGQQARKPDATRRAAPQAAQPAPARERVLSSGSSMTDQAGCVGGSLPHTAHEGLSQSGSMEYKPPVEYDRERTWLTAEQESAAVLKHVRISPQQMRSAVVMAEVLNRPVSMRERRVGGRAR